VADGVAAVVDVVVAVGEDAWEPVVVAAAVVDVVVAAVVEDVVVAAVVEDAAAAEVAAADRAGRSAWRDGSRRPQIERGVVL